MVCEGAKAPYTINGEHVMRGRVNRHSGDLGKRNEQQMIGMALRANARRTFSSDIGVSRLLLIRKS